MSYIGSDHWSKPSAAVSEAFVKFSEKYPFEFFLNKEKNLEENSLNKRIPFERGTPLANRLSHALINKLPFSCIRISDGEGNVISALVDVEVDDPLDDFCRETIAHMHFGDRKIILENRRHFDEIMSNAIETADVIGFPLMGTIEKNFSHYNASTDIRAIFGNRMSFVLRGEPIALKAQAHSDAWLSRGLLPHYSSIASFAKDIYFVGVYSDLPELLSEVWEKEVSFIEVPKQAIFVPDKFRANTMHYPDAMERIVNELGDVGRGDLVIVAAGLLGKHYCCIAKLNGAVAVDIGSVAEVWMGIQARGMDPKFIESWRIKQ